MNKRFNEGKKEIINVYQTELDKTTDVVERERLIERINYFENATREELWYINPDNE
jgi:hypothetical protein